MCPAPALVCLSDVQLCDFGCAKKRSDEPRYGPASGTKDWQAPEQMAADAVEGPKGGWTSLRSAVFAFDQ